MPNDHDLILAIHRILDGTEWGPETLDEIAEVLKKAGYRIREPWEED